MPGPLPSCSGRSPGFASYHLHFYEQGIPLPDVPADPGELHCDMEPIEILRRFGCPDWIDLGNGKVWDYYRPHPEESAVGCTTITTPEATALELVGYYERCGGLDNVATVLAELSERIRGQDLQAEAKRCPVAWVQRLGYLLELVGADELAARLQPIVAGAKEEAALVRSLPRLGSPRQHRWKLAINASVVPDF